MYTDLYLSQSIRCGKPFRNLQNAFLVLILICVAQLAISSRDFGSRPKLITPPTSPISDGDLDTSFNPSIMEGNGVVRRVAIQSDGKIVAVGSFYWANGKKSNNIARLNPDGTTDLTFNGIGTGPNGDVFAVVIQPDGKILIGGRFTTFNEQSTGRIVRLNTDGSLDESFTLAANINTVYDLVLHTDGKILVGGIVSIPGVSGHICRLNPDGSIDSSFNSNNAGVSGNFIFKVLAQSDGKILIGGNFTSYNGAGVSGLVRLNPDGSRDQSFTPPTITGSIYNILVMPDGTIWASGAICSVNSQPTPDLILLNANGSLNTIPTAISPTGCGIELAALVATDDGKVLFGYLLSGVSKLIRINSDGTEDFSYSQPNIENSFVSSLIRDGDGKLFLCGNFVSYNGAKSVRLARIFADGSRDSTFAPEISVPGIVRTVLLQSDGKILIGGNFEYINGIRRTAIARLFPDGSLDETFDPGRLFNGVVLAVAVQSDGKIFAGGTLYRTDSLQSGSHLVRLNSDGSLDRFYEGLHYFSVSGVAVLPDGKLIAGSGYTPAGNDIAAVRFNVDGTRDLSFQTFSISGTVRALLVEPSGRIWVAHSTGTGAFRLNSDGVFDNTVNIGASVTYALSRAAGGKTVLGGGTLRRVNPDGSLDTSLNIGTPPNRSILSMVVQPDEKIIVGGDFTQIGGSQANRLARINSNGSFDSTFDIGTGVTGSVYSLALHGSGDVLVGGNVYAYNNNERYSLLKLRNQPLSKFVTVSGRVLSPNGQGLRSANVSITDSSGNRQTGLTSSFGVYQFQSVRSGDVYTVSVASKRYRFAPTILTVNGAISNLDFIGLE